MIQSTNFPIPSTGIRYISIVNDDVVWISAYDGSGNTETRQDFSLTIDGGETWTAGLIDVGSATVDIAMIHGIDANNAWAVGFPNTSGQGGIFHTSDGGSTWARQESAAYSANGAFANVVWMDVDGNGFCQGDPIDGYYELYTTEDFGTTWIRVPEANIPPPISGEWGYIGQIYSAGSTLWFTTNKGRIFRSIDMGLNWVVFVSPVSDFGGTDCSIAFTNDNYGLITNDTGAVWITEDGGETWTEANITGTALATGLAFVEGTMFAVSTGAATGAAGSSWTEDGGLTWNVNIDDQDQHTFMAINENHEGWSGGFTAGDGSGGGISKYVGTYISVDEMDAVQNVTCFPNPTNGLFHVQSEEKIMNVRIVNFLGQVMNQIEGTDTYMTLDMANFGNGVYFVEVNTLSAKHTVRIIKK